MQILSKPESDALRATCAGTAAWSRSQDLANLLEAPPEELAQRDVAESNLLLATGLHEAEELNIPRCLATIGEWTEVVAAETERQRLSFRPNPSCPTDAHYRGYMLVKTLRDAFGLKHHLLPERGTGFVGDIDRPADGTSGFEDSRPVFLHGLLGPERMGSCASLPVLYAAVGRRLGYPIRLGLAVGHVFIRWDEGSGGQRFNIEGSGPDYINCHPDHYYVDKPRPWTNYERNSGYYLRSITPQEELAVFCSLRGACLEAAGKLDDAPLMFSHACALAPRDPMYPAYLRKMQRTAFAAPPPRSRQ